MSDWYLAVGVWTGSKRHRLEMLIEETSESGWDLTLRDRIRFSREMSVEKQVWSKKEKEEEKEGRRGRGREGKRKRHMESNCISPTPAAQLFAV